MIQQERITLRRAKEEDWKRIYDLYTRLSDDDLYLRYFHFYRPSESEIKKLVNTNDHITVLAELGNNVVGEGTIYEDGEFSLVVDPKYRRNGIGTLIVKELIKEGIENFKFSKVKFYTLPENFPMISLGKKLGFKICYDQDEVYGELRIKGSEKEIKEQCFSQSM
ncbi:GNAT family N-acetyltransferase [Acidianus sulfidivorans JP7]|uniref:GNAT family N-acetyltransferase n=1 Tax=Acidianus sulfidivorans JP7 TaxID=619593 RepID=A0A2U9IJW9_9CREN|nr:GNAT family N-acetyltransferase [Acidianus sulfidivorans]AWR96214.1 GNAT family N-acetyltransferase [Acidianus sulfidivorans JP7]